MHDMGACLELRARIEQGLKNGTIAKKQKFNIEVARERKLSSWNNDRSAVVPPHGIEGEADFVRHGGTIPRRLKDTTQSALPFGTPLGQRCQCRERVPHVAALPG